MAEQREGGSGREGARYFRHDEAFRREMVAQWNNSGLSIRAFCRQHGLAISTFGLWRKRVDHDQPPVVPLTVTADTAFIAAATGTAPAAQAMTDTALSKGHDQVVIALASARIELTGAHAARIVHFVLGQLGGGRC
ncbi:IS66 family insertion sequence element accessory protein TnpA [Cupriavidus lacunae]|uniref:Transposase n=1 Tax=Cupriavidus lacunae TaxID=2666307 RepID=A0A370NL34_9BURK|nr:transposase [Cupriavidus lacunae]RDK06300.1 hypothetical protein DN412_32045 [Cupriavidus lacunae]